MNDRQKHICVEVLVSLSVLYGTVESSSDSLSFQFCRCQETFEAENLALFYREASIFMEMVGNTYSKKLVPYQILEANLQLLKESKDN